MNPSTKKQRVRMLSSDQFTPHATLLHSNPSLPISSNLSHWVLLPLIFMCIGYISIHANPNILHSIHPVREYNPLAQADWTIVGAGPAGIATIGVLIDLGVPTQRITWVDPEFNVGRLGAFYQTVPGNNKPAGFIGFINACQVFQECNCPAIDYLKQIDPNSYPELSVIIEPLRCITDHLRTKINSLQDSMTSLHFDNDLWYVGTFTGSSITSNHVVLATGSHPKTLNYQCNQIVPLDVALNRELLSTLVKPTDTVAVVGSSHSAILLLKFLSEMPVKSIYNFYKQPILYAIDMGGWFSNPFTGLRGTAAQWAQEVLEKNPPSNLQRIYSDHATLHAMLPTCDKVIYAIGFERNELPSFDGTPISTYHETSGFIAPRLFGIGIAFPELSHDGYGNEVHRIGLESFMSYAQRLVPQWTQDDLFKQETIRTSRKQFDVFKKMADLFEIQMY